MPDMSIRYATRGSVFDKGAADSRAAQMLIAINEAVAQEGYDRVHRRLAQDLQHPTGYYQSRIVIDRKAVTRLVTDSGVSYGGWLEGISSRNDATRFKGYHVFRDVKQTLDRDRLDIAAPVVAQFVKEMGR